MKSVALGQDPSRLYQIQPDIGTKAIEDAFGHNSSRNTIDYTESCIDWQYQPSLQQHPHPDASLLQRHGQDQESVSPPNERSLEERFTHILLNTLEAGFKDIDSSKS